MSAERTGRARGSPARRQPRFRRGLAVRVLLVAALVAFAALMSEAAVRLYVLVRYDGSWAVYNVWNAVYEAHAHSWYRVKPDGEFRIFGGRYVARSDSHGFRSPEPDPVKPQDGYRIAFLGGSTTFNSEAPDNDDTVPMLVGRALQQAYPELAIEVLNAGTPGYTTLESLTTLVSRVLPLEPDLVVVYHGINDAVFRTGGEYREDYWRPPKPADTRFDGFLYRWSLLYRFALYKSLVRRTPERAPADRLERERQANSPQTFERNLRSIVSVARAHGAEPVLCTFAYCPLPERGNAAQWDVVFRAIDEQNEIVRRVAAETEAVLVDLAAEFPRDPSLFTDPAHRNVEGLRSHADILVRHLIAGGTVGDGPPRR